MCLANGGHRGEPARVNISFGNLSLAGIHTRKIT
jgi:hypothetical protein